MSWNTEETERAFIDTVDLLVRSWVEMLSAKATVWAMTVDLLVRSWVEIWFSVTLPNYKKVDLLVRSWVEMEIINDDGIEDGGRPPREVVSWNFAARSRHSEIFRRPPREVVSWNTLSLIRTTHIVWVDLLVRSWVEILLTIERTFSYAVDLLVRSWVEIYPKKHQHQVDVCRPPREVVSWNV